MTGIGTRIRNRRKELSISQKELGVKCHVGQATISSWEKDRTEPNMENIRALCKALALTTNELVYGGSPGDCTAIAISEDNSFMQSLFEHYQAASERDQELVKTILGIKD